MPSSHVRKRKNSVEIQQDPKRKRSELISQDESSQQDWEVKAIIAENELSYLIDWEDDPVTGERFSPTWEPKANANAAAIATWERKKAEVNLEDRRSSSYWGSGSSLRLVVEKLSKGHPDLEQNVGEEEVAIWISPQSDLRRSEYTSIYSSLPSYASSKRVEEVHAGTDKGQGRLSQSRVGAGSDLFIPDSQPLDSSSSCVWSVPDKTSSGTLRQREQHPKASR